MSTAVGVAEEELALVRASEAALQARRWVWQRASAMVLAVCVLAHLAIIFYAVRSGLSGSAILQRTHGSWWFAGFYAVFVAACAVHVPIGLARIAEEWLGWSGRTATIASRAFAAILLVCGLRAVYAVVWA